MISVVEGVWHEEVATSPHRRAAGMAPPLEHLPKYMATASQIPSSQIPFHYEMVDICLSGSCSLSLKDIYRIYALYRPNGRYVIRLPTSARELRG